MKEAVSLKKYCNNFVHYFTLVPATHVCNLKTCNNAKILWNNGNI